MEVDLIEYIANRTPKNFIQNTIESLEAAYHQAHNESSTYDAPELRRIRAQIRHYRQNKAFRDAGQKSGLNTYSAITSPKGESFPLVSLDGVTYGRIGVNFSNRIPRLAKHRKEIALVNSRLEPYTRDLFDKEVKQSAEGLGVFIVTVHPDNRAPQDMPASIKIGVPYSDCRGWHLFEPIQSFMAAYATPVEIEVPDLALVTLKKRLSGNEKK